MWYLRRRITKWILFLTFANIMLICYKFPDGPICLFREESWTKSFKSVTYLTHSQWQKVHVKSSYNKNITKEDLPLEVLAQSEQLLNGLHDSKYCYEGLNHSSQMIILVKSSVDNFKSRDSIRMTWGHYHLHSKISIVFLLSALDNTLPDNIDDKLNEEINVYGDLIINRGPHSKNINIQNLFAILWLEMNCPDARFAVILHEHIFFNIKEFINWIYSTEETLSSFYGQIETKLNNFSPGRKQWTTTAIFFSINLIPEFLDKAWKATLANTKNIFNHVFPKDDAEVTKLNVQQIIFGKIKHNLDFCHLEEAICIPAEDIQWPVGQYSLWHRLAYNSSICSNNTLGYKRVTTQYVF